MNRAGTTRARGTASRATRTLWGGGRGLDPAVAAYTAAGDRSYDGRLLRWDLYGTLAHVEGLAAIGLVSEAEAGRLRSALRRGLEASRRGTLAVTGRDEDVHTAVERYLVASLGALGEKVHAGRSRNDQVLADLRLYMKDALLAIESAALDAAAALVAFGGRHRRVLWPGYTHQRRAMPSTVGLWAGGYAEAILDDLVPLHAAVDLIDRSPLGSAAGFGVPLPLDRAKVASALGFASVQRNVTAVQPSRGKHEALVLAALWALGHDLGKLAWDVILFSSEEFGFLQLPESLATGSSIMPHKRNPDLFELTRAREAVLAGCLAQSVALAGKLPGGYHRDFQMSKAPLMTALDVTAEMASAIALAVPRLEVDRERCRAAIDPAVLATDEVYRRVRSGVPFRRAYRQVAAEVRAGETPAMTPSPAEILGARVGLGGAGNPGLDATRREVAQARRSLDRRRRRFQAALARLAGSTEGKLFRKKRSHR